MPRKPVAGIIGDHWPVHSTFFRIAQTAAKQYISVYTPKRQSMSIATLNDIFFKAVERNLDRMMLYRDEGKWLPVSSREFGQKVASVARTLLDWGIRKGDRVAILSENRPEWSIADMATLLLGAVTVPLYTTLTAEQTAFVLRDSGCRVIFLSSELQFHKVLSIVPQTKIKIVVVMDAVEPLPHPQDVSVKCVTMGDLLHAEATLDPAITTQARPIGLDDLAT